MLAIFFVNVVCMFAVESLHFGFKKDMNYTFKFLHFSMLKKHYFTFNYTVHSTYNGMKGIVTKSVQRKKV